MRPSPPPRGVSTHGRALDLKLTLLVNTLAFSKVLNNSKLHAREIDVPWSTFHLLLLLLDDQTKQGVYVSLVANNSYKQHSFNPLLSGVNR